MNNNASAPKRGKEQVFSIRDFFQLCLQKWNWFLWSVLFFVAIGTLYVLRQQPVYYRSCAVLIQDQQGGSGAAELSSAFSSMGLVASNTSVNNELIALTSPSIMFEVVDRLHLTVNCKEKGNFYWKTLYGKNLPFVTFFTNGNKEESCGFRFDFNPDGTGRMHHFWKIIDGKKKKYDNELSTPKGLNFTVKTVIGSVSVKPNEMFTGVIKEPTTFEISKSSLQGTVEHYTEAVKGDLADLDAEVIDLSIKDVSIERANDILNTIINVYNQKWIDDKNQVANSTSTFINERLEIIEGELGDVDNNISNYKSANGVADLQASAALAMNQSAKQDDEILAVTNQLAMATYVKDYLTNRLNLFSVIPVNTGIGSPTLENQIANYNALLLSRNNLESNSSSSNPIVKDYDVQLSGMRDAIVKSVNSQVASLKNSLHNMERSQGKSQSTIASTPGQAKFLLSVERQQKVKESLYLYLLQKREENDITMAFTAYNTRVITPPYGPLTPVSPKKTLTILAMILMGFCLPAVVIYIKEASNTKVRSRSDLETLSIPLAGEIPHFGKKHTMRKFVSTKKQKQKQIDKPLVVVEEGNRNAINESFRLIRSNLQLMGSHGKSSEVIMLTSFNPGSGKSFIAYNLGLTFAIKGKKTLLIDGDLRHGSLSMYVDSPSNGLSAYLNGKTDDWKSMARPVSGYPSLSVLPIGHRPPNPAELLDNGRISTLLAEAREEYDYVLIDCPPIDIVVDTQSFAPYIDRTVFVMRAGLFDKSLLPQLASLYEEHKYPHISLILNGVETAHGTYSYGNYYYSTSE